VKFRYNGGLRKIDVFELVILLEQELLLIYVAGAGEALRKVGAAASSK